MQLIALIALALVASAYDVTQRTIPNWATAAGSVAGVALAWLGGGSTAALHLLTAALVLLCGLPLYTRGVLGGGDVKLLVAVSALLGPRLLPAALALTALAGGVIALIEAVRRGVLLPLVLEGRDALFRFARLADGGGQLRAAAAASLNVPYGLAIGIGAVGACLV